MSEATTQIALQPCKLLYVSETQQSQVAHLQTLASQHQLSLCLSAELIKDKLNQKRRQQLSLDYGQAVLLLDDKNQLSLLSAGLSVAPEWDKMQRRVVSAGRKSELLLQAAKITADSVVIDATAGFGHDSLILASSGAQVTMLEQQPVMTLLLLNEQRRMNLQPNWQKLMSRLHIINIDALRYFTNKQNTKNKNIDHKSVDMIYLDPMFPEDSYQDSKTGRGAKVGKQMQALHQIAHPPTLIEEQQLLQSAQDLISCNAQQQGRVIVKRPQQAPFFAQQSPDESWHNAAVRFDGYFI
ncbi:class I SAM-dependent methyltransferase [uncultured Psychrobacter sp.]|uniref:class I SAM-dependent methyltransferase n=1 Tax=uncultured Psychrobacter sp. TaxID=259303 RepID=UPI00345A0145